MRFAKDWKLATVALATAAIAAGTGCKKAQVDPFPATGAVAGWEKASDTRVYTAKDLWQYIDGDAEKYVKAGVVSTATSDYKYKSRVDAVVDIYTMGDAEGAHTILAGEQANGDKSVRLGDEGIAYEQSVSFRKGPYFVRIVAYELTPDTGQALLALARGVEAKL